MALNNTHILLGVSGGIAAYKAAYLVRRLRDAGAQVRVVLTASAAHFVGATTFQALSGNAVRSDLWDASAEAAMGHIELARWADRIVIAPASADLMARLAHGHADDLLTTLCLASPAPLSIAPAMNQQMWHSAAVQDNAERLRARGVQLIGPAAGDQACGDVGPGRMVEPEAIVAALAASLGSVAGDKALQGKRVMVTAGPTHEALDPVRFMGNRSSGKMGFAVAAAARDAGASVIMVSGPVALLTPHGVERIDVRSAAQMHEAVMVRVAQCDIFIAAAAVADYRPLTAAAHKISKESERITIELVRNPDIVAAVAAHTPRPFVVGFAAQTHELEERARAKLEGKNMDLIAANLVGDNLGFERDDNSLLLLWQGGRQQLPQASKQQLAQALVAQIAQQLQEGADT